MFLKKSKFERESLKDCGKIICVDLDGTLIKADLSWSSAKKFWSKGFFNIFRLLVWYLRGIPYLKCRLAEEIDIEPSTLLYNSELISYLIQKKSEGSKVFLATGATEKYANRIANYLKIFDGVFASNLKINLVGKNKAKKLAKAFPNGFAYAGNSTDDLHVWKKASENIVVNPSKSVQRAMLSVPHTLYKF